jgi:hypothetical protein
MHVLYIGSETWVFIQACYYFKYTSQDTTTCEKYIQRLKANHLLYYIKMSFLGWVGVIRYSLCLVCFFNDSIHFCISSWSAFKTVIYSYFVYLLQAYTVFLPSLFHTFLECVVLGRVGEYHRRENPYLSVWMSYESRLQYFFLNLDGLCFPILICQCFFTRVLYVHHQRKCVTNWAYLIPHDTCKNGWNLWERRLNTELLVWWSRIVFKSLQ